MALWHYGANENEKLHYGTMALMKMKIELRLKTYPSSVENGSNISQSVPNIQNNHQKQILDLNNVYGGRLKKAPWNPLPKKKRNSQIFKTSRFIFIVYR